jgi:hypothetical protein
MDKDFYINEIKILEWLTNDDTQVLRFKDRIEYRENNQLSRIDGPAIEYYSGLNNKYYYKGKKLSSDEFQLISKKEKMKEIENYE